MMIQARLRGRFGFLFNRFHIDRLKPNRRVDHRQEGRCRQRKNSIVEGGTSFQLIINDFDDVFAVATVELEESF